MIYIHNPYRANSYNRVAAVNYALTFALKPNPAYRYFPLINDRSGDCANFLSQCLRAGGSPISHNTKYSWWYNNKGTTKTSDDTWSLTWTVANSLYWFLKVNQANNYPAAKGLEVADPTQLELGDLIFFEDDKGFIFHSTIVTGFSGSVPLVSHHSFEAINIPYTSSWKASRYHYIKVSV